MKVHILKPFSLEKNIGKAYNEAMSLIPDGDSGCIMDLDTMFLTPDAGNIIYGYAEKYPNAVLVCHTNRIHPSSPQLYSGIISSQSDVKEHILIAQELAINNTFEVKKITSTISGFLMIIPKHIWNEHKFHEEDRKLLGCDSEYSTRLITNGVEILLMKSLYIWHTYRLLNGPQDKSHLR